MALIKCPECGKEKAIKAFLKNKKVVTATIITVVVIVLAIIATCAIYNSHMEKVTLEQIEEHIENEEYEFAFDKINSGHISDEGMEKYREIVIPHMQDEFTAAKKSERETLSLIVDAIEYLFYDAEYVDNSDYIYTMENNKRTILYEAPKGNWDLIGGSYISAGYHLDPYLCIYANNCLLFVEEKSIGSLTDRNEYYSFKCLDLNTGVSKEIGNGEDFMGIYKLEDGSIFVQYDDYQNYSDVLNGHKRNLCGGVRYNPYTKVIKEGENVASEEEIENAIYGCGRYGKYSIYA